MFNCDTSKSSSRILSSTSSWIRVSCPPGPDALATAWNAAKSTKPKSETSSWSLKLNPQSTSRTNKHAHSAFQTQVWPIRPFFITPPSETELNEEHVVDVQLRHLKVLQQDTVIYIELD